MSIDVYNSRVKMLGLTLPGDDDELTDDRRGWVGWGPHDGSASPPGGTVVHRDWKSMAATLSGESRVINDFFFRIGDPSEPCGACAGSGRSREYAELEAGFEASGGGRWAGWGKGPLLSKEVDFLVKTRGLGHVAAKGKITEKNIRRHLGRSSRGQPSCYELLPLRAASLGIDCNECFECVGTGLLQTAPTRISLFMWTFDTECGPSRIDVCEDVKPAELPEVRKFLAAVGWEGVKERFRWAYGGAKRPDIRYVPEFLADTSAMFLRSSWWKDCVRYSSFSEFSDRGSAHDWYNDTLILDFRIFADTKHFVAEERPGFDFPEVFSIHLTRTLPRDASSQVFVIDGCVPSDADELRFILMRSFRLHERHFAWASGQKVPAGKCLSSGESGSGSYDPVRFFAGR